MRHCWTALSSPSWCRQKRFASREQACCSGGVPVWPWARTYDGRPDRNTASANDSFFIGDFLLDRDERQPIAAVPNAVARKTMKIADCFAGPHIGSPMPIVSPY